MERLDEHLTACEPYTAQEQDEAYARAMVASMHEDPNLGICDCGRFTSRASTYFPLCTTCGWALDYAKLNS